MRRAIRGLLSVGLALGLGASLSLPTQAQGELLFQGNEPELLDLLTRASQGQCQRGCTVDDLAADRLGARRIGGDYADLFLIRSQEARCDDDGCVAVVMGVGRQKVYYLQDGRGLTAADIDLPDQMDDAFLASVPKLILPEAGGSSQAVTRGCVPIRPPETRWGGRAVLFRLRSDSVGGVVRGISHNGQEDTRFHPLRWRDVSLFAGGYLAIEADDGRCLGYIANQSSFGELRVASWGFTFHPSRGRAIQVPAGMLLYGPDVMDPIQTVPTPAPSTGDGGDEAVATWDGPEGFQPRPTHRLTKGGSDRGFAVDRSGAVSFAGQEIIARAPRQAEVDVQLFESPFGPYTLVLQWLDGQGGAAGALVEVDSETVVSAPLVAPDIRGDDLWVNGVFWSPDNRFAALRLADASGFVDLVVLSLSNGQALRHWLTDVEGWAGADPDLEALKWGEEGTLSVPFRQAGTCDPCSVRDLVLALPPAPGQEVARLSRSSVIGAYEGQTQPAARSCDSSPLFVVADHARFGDEVCAFDRDVLPGSDRFVAYARCDGGAPERLGFDLDFLGNVLMERGGGAEVYWRCSGAVDLPERLRPAEVAPAIAPTELEEAPTTGAPAATPPPARRPIIPSSKDAIEALYQGQPSETPAVMARWADLALASHRSFERGEEGAWQLRWANDRDDALGSTVQAHVLQAPAGAPVMVFSLSEDQAPPARAWQNLTTRELRAAINLAQIGIEREQSLLFTGHGTGGVLAQVAGLSTGQAVVTFSSRPLNEDELARLNPSGLSPWDMTSFVISHEMAERFRLMDARMPVYRVQPLSAAMADPALRPQVDALVARHFDGLPRKGSRDALVLAMLLAKQALEQPAR